MEMVGTFCKMLLAIMPVSESDDQTYDDIATTPPLTQALFNSLYAPFGSPCRGQKPQKRGM